MDVGDDRHVWLRRMRWRLRGAWQAPAFALFTVADAIVLQLLPFQGDDGPGWIATLILAGFLNLAMVAVVGPLASVGLRRRDPTLPSFAARDRAAVWALSSLCVLLLAGGLIHRPALQDQRDKLLAQAIAARGYFAHQAPPAVRRNLAQMTTWKAGPDLYRTCVPTSEAGHAVCVYVKTEGPRPTVTLDPSQEPNSVVAGPGERSGVVR